MIGKLQSAAADLIGLAGLCALTRGLWVGYGEPIALIVTGSLLIGLAVYSAAKGSS